MASKNSQNTFEKYSKNLSDTTKSQDAQMRSTILVSGIAIIFFIVLIYFYTEILSAPPGTVGFLQLFFAILTTGFSSYTTYKIATIQNGQTQRRYALQAAKKVANISKQLTELAGNIKVYFDGLKGSESSVEIQHVSMGEYLRHLPDQIMVIESMNEGSLSDWEEIIGPELQQRRTAQTEVEFAEFRLLTNVLEMREKANKTYKVDFDAELKGYFDSVQKIEASSPIPLTKSATARPVINPNVPCPNCGYSVIAPILLNHGDTKHVKCTNCGENFPVHRIGDTLHAGGKLVSHKDSSELETSKVEIICPNCGTQNESAVKPHGFQAFLLKECSDCGKPIQILVQDGVITKAYTPHFRQQFQCPNCNASNDMSITTPFLTRRISHCKSCGSTVRISFNQHQLVSVEILNK